MTIDSPAQEFNQGMNPLVEVINKTHLNGFLII